MPIYEFKCHLCGCRVEDMRVLGDTSPPSCPDCSAPMSRRFTPVVSHVGFEPHFNQAAGAYVSNETQLKDAFKRASDEATARTGTEHRFVPVDPRDKDACGVTDEGLEETYRRAHDEGRANTLKWL